MKKKFLLGLISLGATFTFAQTPVGGINYLPQKDIQSVENLQVTPPNPQTQNLGEQQINVLNLPSYTWLEQNLSNTSFAEDISIIQNQLSTPDNISKTYNVACLYWDGDWCVILGQRKVIDYYHDVRVLNKIRKMIFTKSAICSFRLYYQDKIFCVGEDSLFHSLYHFIREEPNRRLEMSFYYGNYAAMLDAIYPDELTPYYVYAEAFVDYITASYSYKEHYEYASPWQIIKYIAPFYVTVFDNYDIAPIPAMTLHPMQRFLVREYIGFYNQIKEYPVLFALFDDPNSYIREESIYLRRSFWVMDRTWLRTSLRYDPFGYHLDYLKRYQRFVESGVDFISYSTDRPFLLYYYYGGKFYLDGLPLLGLRYTDLSDDGVDIRFYFTGGGSRYYNSGAHDKYDDAQWHTREIYVNAKVDAVRFIEDGAPTSIPSFRFEIKPMGVRVF